MSQGSTEARGASGVATIRYELSMTEPWTHIIDARMTISGLRGEKRLSLNMPAWTPGSYAVRDFARNVLSIEATDTGGSRLALQKVSKSRWVVETANVDAVVVAYRVYAFSLSPQTSHVDADHAVINGASVFLYAKGFESTQVVLSLRPYSGWKVVSTGLERRGEHPWEFVAPDYDTLVDTPIEVGNQHVHSFHAMEARHEVSIFTQKAIDEATLVGDIKKIVESTIPIYGDVPYKRYVFLVDLVGEGYGGLEHHNSTLCIGSYYDLDQPEEYRLFLTLFSHEFFHTWNVKRMRPVALGPFDYSAENYTRSLWIAEGLTSYYEDIILRRAGIFSVPEFLDDIAFSINHVKSLPSSRVQTPEESSFDTWVRFYRQDENSPNVSPSYYRQGAVIGLLLDLEIRSISENTWSLDDVMRAVYRDTYVAEGRGFTDEEFQAACGRLSLGQTDEIFSKYVRGKEEVDFNRYLAHAGLQLIPKATLAAPAEGFLGVRVRGGGGTTTVVTRLTGSPAEAADLSSGDEIIATDGLRTDAQKLSYYIATRKPGTTVDLTIARGGVLKVVSPTLGPRPALEYRIVKKDSASEAEKRTFAAWAIGNWDDPLVYREHRASPVTPKALDYI